MNIGQASAATGLPVKTIRYYEEIGLVSPDRAANGYRDFAPKDVDVLHILVQARMLGFTLQECRDLIALEADQSRNSRDVRKLAQQNLANVRSRIRELQRLEAQLSELVSRCRGDETPDCAILDALTHPKLPHQGGSSVAR